VAVRLSLVIPTYNRADYLRSSLSRLCAQTLPADEFEVIVADDGSTDGTAQVVEDFRDRLQLKYHFHEHTGYRAAGTRNAGARLAAAPVIAFIDSGVLPGTGFADAHLRAHAASGPAGRVVLSWMHAYSPWPTPAAALLADLLKRLPLEEVAQHCMDDPALREPRYADLHAVDLDLSRRSFPEELLWTANCSVRAADFWAVGGFDEEYRGWGMEDIDLGFRLARRGVEFHFAPDAWIVESSHKESLAHLDQMAANMRRFLEKYAYCVPTLELFWLAAEKSPVWFGVTERENRAVLGWTERCRGEQVRDELEPAFGDLPQGARVAVFGCGADIPPSDSALILADFDAHVVGELTERGHGGVRNNIGIRLPLEEGAVDVVLITSRMRGLWERFSEPILAEASRIGAETRVLFDTRHLVTAG
jgi:glycosyltransferase involved in cell wall biosynthesis